MRVRFVTAELRQLYENPDFVPPRFGRDVIRAYRKKVGFLIAAASEMDLRIYRALHFEKLRGDREGQHSIRLNDRWRLILHVETGAEGRVLVVLEIVDYH
jgi:proteic killer suppression protein